MRRVTLASIAQITGFSLMTVSRALRRAYGVKPQTRQKVQTVARRLGYRPDPVLGALVSYRSARQIKRDYSVIAFVTHFDSASDWRKNYANRQAFQGAAGKARQLGFQLQAFWLPPRSTQAGSELSRMLVNRGIRGLLLCPLQRLEAAPVLDWKRFSVVAVGYSMREPTFTFVASHHTQLLSQALGHLRQLGYRRPALVFNPWADERTCHQLGGAWFLDQQSIRPRDRLPILQQRERWSPDEVKEWIARHRPDVLIDTFAVEDSVLRGTRLRAPEDIGYINTNVPSARGRISGVYQNFSALGAISMIALNDLLNRGETGPSPMRSGIVLDGSWCSGVTVTLQSPVRNGISTFKRQARLSF